MSKKKIKVALIMPLGFVKLIPEDFRSFYCANMQPFTENLLRVLEQDNEFSYHVISSTMEYRETIRFTVNGVSYTILSLLEKGIEKRRPFLLRYLAGFSTARSLLNAEIESIGPNVISVHGTQGDLMYASAHLTLPKILTIDMFYDLFARKNRSIVHLIYAKMEKKMLRSFRHFTYRTELMKQKILQHNTSGILHYFGYPLDIDSDLIGNCAVKEIDIVFAARLHKYKGAERFIDLMQMIHSRRQEIRSVMIGAGNTEYIRHLQSIVNDKGLKDIVSIRANIESHRQYLEVLSRSRLNLYPLTESMTSATVIESLAVGTPLVSIRSAVLSKLNTRRESVTLIEDDNNTIVSSVFSLLENEDRLLTLSKNGIETFMEQFYKPDELILDNYKTAIRACADD